LTVDELKAYEPQVMAVLGFLLQYTRGYKRFPEQFYHGLAVVLAALGYVLFNHLDFTDWRLGTVRAIVGVSGLILPLWGGTFVASSAAKAGAGFVPVTDSK
jgi:hypothetical protein